ncbi:MAG: protein translocase subunit SecF [Pseudomonadota bacterium]
MSMNIIRPGTTIEFMNRRKFFLFVSAAMVLLSLASVLFVGLNLGIDFKGGTKVILAFKGDQTIDRDRIRDLSAETFAKMMDAKDLPQVQVQDFYAGGTDDTGERRYVIYTELVSLLTDTEKKAIVQDFSDTFEEGTVVNAPQEGGDQFYISFKDPVPIAGRIQEIEAIFARHKLDRIVVEAEKVRDMHLEHIKDLNLMAEEDDSEDEAIDRILAGQDFEKRLAEFKAKTTDRNFTVRIEEVKAAVETAVKSDDELGPMFLAVESATTVSPSVGRDMLNEGLLALLYAIIGILLYIALRFDFKYGPGAVVALTHDAVITVGIFAVTQIPFTLPIIAAVLTIVGYSVNDTIVVFDRIRENVSKLREKSLDRVINISINETLSRTLLTSITTLLVVLSVWILGGGLIKDFAFALIIGVIIGTYSSIFVASPVLLYLDKLLRPKGA